MLIPEIICVVVVPVIVLVYLVLRSKPRRFRLSIEGGWKQIKLNIEVDALDKPGELPGNQPDQT